MTISPPESTHNSDDEDLRGRSRELEQENLAELQAVIRSLRGERKSGSPVRPHGRGSLNGKAASEGSSPSDESRPPLSGAQRKISHSRSTTDSNIVFDIKPTDSHTTTTSQPALLSPRAAESDSDDSEGLSNRPPMVRKKSGELVKPALRPHSRRRPSSMPGTPTYSKAVHFDSQLEHIRHFLQVDRPLAVSAGSSPAENYESEAEFPFGSDESSARPRGSSYEWEILLANFPQASTDRRHLPVHVERVFLSSDKKNLIGVVAVQNLAFQKQVTARFTFDYWKTTSEVAAEFSNDVRRTAFDHLDRFTFSISLADQNNLENKTLYFCVRYNVNGQEFWDSNNSTNYQVDFAKKPKAKAATVQQPNGVATRPLNGLPRSRPSPPVSSGRPKSMPISFDDFGSDFGNFGAPFTQSPTSLIGESKIKLRNPRPKQELVADAPARRNKSSAPMFGHRYNFNSSLSAAKSSAYAVLGEQSGLPAVGTKQSSREVPVVGAKIASKSPRLDDRVSGLSPAPTAPAVSASVTASKPAALFSEKPSLSSQSYQELVDKYCFFGSAKASSAMSKAVASSFDGATDDHSDSDVSFESAQSSGSSSPAQDETLSLPAASQPDSSNHHVVTPNMSRSSHSPALSSSCVDSSRSRSPVFGFPFHQTPSQTLLTHTPQAAVIRG